MLKIIMLKYKKNILILFCAFFLLQTGGSVLAHQPRIVYTEEGIINIENHTVSQAFYDELRGVPRDYFIKSENDFELYINILVPAISNPKGRYSANVYLVNGENQEKIISVDASIYKWTEYYEEYGRDYYYKGPEFSDNLGPGIYKIEIFSEDNQGRYVLAVGKKEEYDIKSLLNLYWQLPLLKMTFFESDVLQFFLTPFGIAGIGFIGGIFIFFAIFGYIVSLIKETIKKRKAKTLLLTSDGMSMKEEITKLLQKPAYDITVAFITTAAKPIENLDYLKRDWNIMRDEMGFNVEEVDIEGKKEAEIMRILEIKDIIFVEGGNTFYLLSAMRKCNFKKIIKKLLKYGKVYIGVSAGTIVAGKTIQTADWKKNKEKYGITNMKGLGLVPFDIFVHYKPEHAELIKKKKPWKWQRRRLKIITDGQAILIQGKEAILIGKGEKVVV